VPVMDSQPSAENDDFFLSVILEGADRLSSGIHCLRLSPWLLTPLKIMLQNVAKCCIMQQKGDHKMSNTVAVRLPAPVVNDVKIIAEKALRSVPKQIEYMIRLARAVENNPDLPATFVRDALAGLDDVASGNVSHFEYRV